MYFTANGRALPCCIAPFSQRGYENYTLGDATQQTLREIWNGAAYQDFRAALLSDEPPRSVRELRLALEPLGDAAGRAASPSSFRRSTRRPRSARVVARAAARLSSTEIIVADGGSTDGTAEIARRRRRAR